LRPILEANLVESAPSQPRQPAHNRRPAAPIEQNFQQHRGAREHRLDAGLVRPLGDPLQRLGSKSIRDAGSARIAAAALPRAVRAVLRDGDGIHGSCGAR
jgi:hypothetical protein